ncbi:5'-3' exonuclease H3TH domain-containing protein [Marinicella sp. W31]|uniref:5'-3' exonuclease n=1 Tax=Marinicella sp. W31 TaxID=3023713 RepID=UPI00375770EB
MMQSSAKPVYLIDSSIFIFRSYYAVPDEFFDAQGHSINALYGFARFLTRFLQQTQADLVALAFDESLSTSFRNEIYPAYKANRDPAPESLKIQMRRCRELAELLGIATYADDCYEADDLIGSLHHCYKQKGHEITIVSADKDLAQLLQAGDNWWDYGKSEPLNGEGVCAKMGVHPHQVCDFLALAGDKVDNIPGVPGIGAKTAAALLKHFGNLQEILKRSREIEFLSIRGAKSCMNKIRQFEKEALISQQLSRIVTDVPLENSDIIRRKSTECELLKFIEDMRFGPLLRRQLLEAAGS